MPVVMNERQAGARMARISRRGRDSVLIWRRPPPGPGRGGQTLCAFGRRRRTKHRLPPSGGMGVRWPPNRIETNFVRPSRAGPKNLRRRRADASRALQTFVPESVAVRHRRNGPVSRLFHAASRRQDAFQLGATVALGPGSDRNPRTK